MAIQRNVILIQRQIDKPAAPKGRRFCFWLARLS